jgi:hypothetical protein
MNATANVDTDTPKDKREMAISLAERGFRVFPLVVDGRKPAIDKWPERASDDPAIVARFWSDDTGAPKHYNIGIATGRGLVVLDFDCKHGKAGLAALDAWDDIPGALPPSLRARTASGGVHVYLSVPEDVDLRNTVEKLAPGVDVRAYHGYVIAPGSTIGDLVYEWLTPADSPIEPMPDDMIERCARARVTERDDRPALVDLDAPAAIRRSIDYLRDEAPEATQGCGGDLTTYQVAGRVKDLGISPDVNFDLMSEHWNEAGKAIPPWNPEELQALVAHAYRYGTSPIGIASPAADFVDLSGVVDMSGGPEHDSADVGNLYYVGFDDAARQALAEHPAPLIKGLLDQRAFSVVYGESNSGKTFVALDMAYHVAAGVAWGRKKAQQGLAIYLAAEGGRGIFRRLAALKQAKGGENLPLVLIPCPVNLLNSEADINALLAIVRAVAADYGTDPSLVVVDTLSRVLAGGDENTSKDMGALIKNFDRVRAVTQAHLMVVHHSGKDKAKGARGHSSLRAATDTEIEIVDGTIKVTKQRDMDSSPPIRFKLETVDLGVDSDGDQVTSCVLAVAAPGEVFGDEMDSEDILFMRAIADEKGVLPSGSVIGARMAAIKQDELNEIARWSGEKQDAKVMFFPQTRGVKQEDFACLNHLSAVVSYQTVSRCKTRLQTKGIIEKTKKGQWVRKQSDMSDMSDT